MSQACYKVPLWLDEPYAPRPAPTGDATCEVCVIGGGAGGVAAAWRLAQRGRDVLLLEAREIASGASGRNGGFFLAGVAPMYDRARELWGRERAMGLYALTRAAQDEMLATAQDIGVRDEFRVSGLLRLGVDATEAEAVRCHHAALRQDGFPGELVAESGLPSAARRPGRLGLLTPHDGSMHPARWVRALAAAAERTGARVHEGTPVTAPPRADGEGVVIATATGTVRADRVVVAADGWLSALVPAASHVRPRRLNMLATAPAPEILPTPIYARDGHEYAQQLPDGRIALGGFSDLDAEESWTDRAVPSDRVQARLEAYLREELGVEAPVTHRWAGVVGYAADPVPTVGAADPDGRVVAMGGYNGTGVVQSWVAARIATELICDGASAVAGLYAPVSSSAAHSPE